jgi:hypothetical protein
MKFLNKQEQVIDLQLTQYGKYLLSTGKFKPVFYAFFDDGILYDPEYGYGIQKQKDIQNRIKSETPQLETQYNFRGVETEVKKNNELIRSQEQWEKRFFEDQSISPPDTTTDKQYALQNIIGSSDSNSQKAPAWNINFLIGEITSSVTTTSWVKGDYSNRINIPQITASNVVYNTAIKKVDAASTIGFEDSNIYGNEYIDVWSDDDGILIDVSEFNMDFEKDQYEIEVYEVEEESISNGKGGTRENLIPLYFVKYPERIKDGILLDKASYVQQLNAPGFDDFNLDARYAEYFMEINVDNEIDKDVLCKHAKDTTLGIYSTRFLDCEDEDVKREIDARNIYNTDVTEEDLKDC